MVTTTNLIWLVAAVCFIFSLGGLSQHETARRGNWLGIVGILLAIAATFLSGFQPGFGMPLVVLSIGAAIGVYFGVTVKMTSMPQLVAILHSFVGLAAVFVGLSVFIVGETGHEPDGNTQIILGNLIPADLILPNETAADKLVWHAHGLIHRIEIFLGILIGGLTFTGSVIAWGKLDGKIGSKPMLIPARHWINAGMLAGCLVLGWWFVTANSFATMLIAVVAMLVIAFIFGAHLVMAIGGADMPVVVSMLNSYSGWAAAATGFMLANDLLIITGALVGSSGAILSYIMCAAMNRSFVSVILGGFGNVTSGGDSNVVSPEDQSHNPTYAREVARMLQDAKNVIIIPGYGMAVAQAQHPIREIVELLQANGTRVRFAIHPVAGRLPGHMNVLLAEARLPYDLVWEMDEINDGFPDADVALVVGANDIVNPGAQADVTSPIYGMPVLEAWKAKQVVVFKRSMGTGYSGAENPLFYLDNTQMLLGDAKASADEILSRMRS
jgi:NAD(P) transhydrogenase subunit beta